MKKIRVIGADCQAHGTVLVMIKTRFYFTLRFCNFAIDDAEFPLPASQLRASAGISFCDLNLIFAESFFFNVCLVDLNFF